jgi:hypothetical protein
VDYVKFKLVDYIMVYIDTRYIPLRCHKIQIDESRTLGFRVWGSRFRIAIIKSVCV